MPCHRKCYKIRADDSGKFCKIKSKKIYNNKSILFLVIAKSCGSCGDWRKFFTSDASKAHRFVCNECTEDLCNSDDFPPTTPTTIEPKPSDGTTTESNGAFGIGWSAHSLVIICIVGGAFCWLNYFLFDFQFFSHLHWLPHLVAFDAYQQK